MMFSKIVVAAFVALVTSVTAAPIALDGALLEMRSAPHGSNPPPHGGSPPPQGGSGSLVSVTALNNDPVNAGIIGNGGSGGIAFAGQSQGGNAVSDVFGGLTAGLGDVTGGNTIGGIGSTQSGSNYASANGGNAAPVGNVHSRSSMPPSGSPPPSSKIVFTASKDPINIGKIGNGGSGGTATAGQYQGGNIISGVFDGVTAGKGTVSGGNYIAGVGSTQDDWNSGDASGGSAAPVGNVARGASSSVTFSKDPLNIGIIGNGGKGGTAVAGQSQGGNYIGGVSGGKTTSFGWGSVTGGNTIANVGSYQEGTNSASANGGSGGPVGNVFERSSMGETGRPPVSSPPSPPSNVVTFSKDPVNIGKIGNGGNGGTAVAGQAQGGNVIQGVSGGKTTSFGGFASGGNTIEYVGSSQSGTNSASAAGGNAAPVGNVI